MSQVGPLLEAGGWLVHRLATQADQLHAVARGRQRLAEHFRPGFLAASTGGSEGGCSALDSEG